MTEKVTYTSLLRYKYISKECLPTAYHLPAGLPTKMVGISVSHWYFLYLTQKKYAIPNMMGVHIFLCTARKIYLPTNCTNCLPNPSSPKSTIQDPGIPSGSLGFLLGSPRSRMFFTAVFTHYSTKFTNFLFELWTYNNDFNCLLPDISKN